MPKILKGLSELLETWLEREVLILTENLIVSNKCLGTIKYKQKKGESYLGMFNSNGAGYSLSDIAAVTEGNNNGNGGWGNNSDWWIILLFLFAFGGFGRGGFGNGGFGGSGGGGGSIIPVTRGELDYSNLDASVRGVQQGLCDGFYAMNTGMLNGFTGIQNTLMNGFHGVDNAICTLGYNMQGGLNTLGH